MTQVMSPRRTSQRRASRSASTSRWRRTAPCRAERRSRTWAASSNRCWAARRDIRAPSASATTDGSPVSACAAASHGGVVRHAVGEPGARALRDAELGGDARCRIGRRDVEATEPGRAAPQRQRREDRLDDEDRHRPRRQRPEVHAGPRRFADDREARPRGVGVEPDVAVLVGAGAGAVVAGERARDQPALDDRGRQRIGERRDA